MVPPVAEPSGLNLMLNSLAELSRSEVSATRVTSSGQFNLSVTALDEIARCRVLNVTE
jgi:hypothetical protein